MDDATRRFRDRDAQHLTELVRASIVAIGPRTYSSEQVAAWLAHSPGPENLKDRAKTGGTIIVAADESDEPVAYALIEEDGHLDHLYVHPGHEKRGLATRLLAEAERHACARGTARLFAEASEPARSVFERAGYSVMHRCDVDLDSVSIHNWAMEKSLE